MWVTMGGLLVAAALQLADPNVISGHQAMAGYEQCRVTSVQRGSSLLVHTTVVTTNRGEFSVYGGMPVEFGDRVVLEQRPFGQQSLCKQPGPSNCHRVIDR